MELLCPCVTCNAGCMRWKSLSHGMGRWHGRNLEAWKQVCQDSQQEASADGLSWSSCSCWQPDWEDREAGCWPLAASGQACGAERGFVPESVDASRYLQRHWWRWWFWTQACSCRSCSSCVFWASPTELAHAFQSSSRVCLWLCSNAGWRGRWDWINKRRPGGFPNRHGFLEVKHGSATGSSANC